MTASLSQALTSEQERRVKANLLEYRVGRDGLVVVKSCTTGVWGCGVTLRQAIEHADRSGA